MGLRFLGFVTSTLCLSTVLSLALIKPASFFDGNKEVVFVDLIQANYEINVDVKGQKVSVNSILTFVQDEAGYPVIDLVQPASLVSVDGIKTELKNATTPDKAGPLSYVNTALSKGTHTIEISHTIPNSLARLESGKISMHFSMSDLSHRQFLERYIPSNFEYDSYQMNFTVKLVPETSNIHGLLVNGKINQIGDNIWTVQAPAYYTSSSLYFHLFSLDDYMLNESTYETLDGRTIPITVYGKRSSSTKTLESFKTNTHKIIKGLENRYGAWPHDFAIVYAQGLGTGGMEYAGATTTGLDSLQHELNHSYFARSALPANGSAGWIDEAIAMWNDADLPDYESPRNKTNMGSRGMYARATDTRAYTDGYRFMSYLSGLLKKEGGLLPFLRGFHGAYNQKSFTNEDFQKFLEDKSERSFEKEFSTWITGSKSYSMTNEVIENPHHPKLTLEQMRELF